MEEKFNISKITKDIDIDYNDPLFTSNKSNKLLLLKEDFFVNLNIFNKNFYKSLLKSRLLWFLAILLPAFMLLIDYIFIGFIWNYNDSLEVGQKPINYDIFISDLINWIFISPLIVLSFISFCSFIFQVRESNLLKRMKIVGLSNIQFFSYFFISSFLFLVILILILIGPVTIIISDLANQITGAKYETYSIYQNIEWGYFITVLFFGIFSSISLSYLIGMKSKNFKMLNFIGIGIYIYASFINSFSILFSVSIINDLDLNNTFWGVLGTFFLLIAKYVFLVAPFTLINFGLIITSDPSYFKDSNEGFYYFTIYFAIIESIFITFLLFFNFEKFFNYDVSR